MSTGNNPLQRFRAHLMSIGVDSHFRSQVAHGDGVEEWLIDVAEGPIRHILIRDEYSMSYSTASDSWDREILYLVPDSRIGAGGSPTLPVGKGVRLDLVRGCWELEGDHWTDFETILMGDPDLDKALMKRAPSRLQWERCQEVAARLLADPIAETESEEEEEGEDWINSEIAQIRLWASEFVQFIKDELDLEARTRDPVTPAEDWVETLIDVAMGAIRQINLFSDGGYWHAALYVPDTRLQTNSPAVSAHLVPAKSFPVFGRVTGVKWNPGEGDLAASLNRDQAVGQALLNAGLTSFGVWARPEQGRWEMGFQETRKWRRPVWDCYEVIAQHLLAFRFSPRPG